MLMLAASHGRRTDGGIVIDLPLSQETLAQLIGSTRQRVTQVLKEWQFYGMVRCQRRGVVLLQPDRLEAMAKL